MIKIYKSERDINKVIKKLEARAEGASFRVVRSVRSIIKNVRKNGDKALIAYAKEFDGVELDSLYMTEEEMQEAENRVLPELKATMQKAAANIRAYHEKQKQEGYEMGEGGIRLGRRVLPLRRVGLYVPGGSAAYPSSVLMNAIPAKVAGVEDIVMATPCKSEGIRDEVIYAARLAGVSRILKVGGAQAIAALAYGTESVERVDKIVGPGNIFVATAKREVFGHVDIDMIAGPSEVTVIADESANPAYLAADMMSQAEHDPLASSILLVTSEEMANATVSELKRQSARLGRYEIIEKSLGGYGAIIVLPGLDAAVELANRIAPEHLELAVDDPFALFDRVKNAGSVFLGHYTPEPLGDYFAGPNHVLPTNGTARFSSPLSVDSFIKKSSYLCYDKAALDAVSEDVVRFALCEGLSAHANSISIRNER